MTVFSSSISQLLSDYLNGLITAEEAGPEVVSLALTLNIVSAVDGSDRLQGTIASDVFFGSSIQEFMFGGKGADIFYTGAGDDYVRAGYGNDTLLGQDGDDRL